MATRAFLRVMPAVVFTVAFGISGACVDFMGGDDDEEPGSSEPPAVGVHHAELKCDAPAELEVDSRLHGCQKVSYASVGRFLAARGVDLKAAGGDPLFAGEVYANAEAFGVPPPGALFGESSFHSIIEASKLFDVFIQAAPEIIANIGDPQKAPACVLNGMSTPMFDASDGSCVESSASCLLGRPATKSDMDLCNAVLDQASPADPNDVATKRRLAVALLLSAGNSCE
jgi:hypothetical protein